MIARASALVAGVGLAAAAAGCGASDSGSGGGSTNAIVDPAAAFAVRVDADLTSGRFGRVWGSLHPGQQLLLRKPESLASCWRDTGQPDLERGLRFEARDVRDQPWQVPGVPGRARPAKAVTVRVLDGKTEKVLDTFTQHVFAIEGRWRWIVSPRIVRALKRGACGGAG